MTGQYMFALCQWSSLISEIGLVFDCFDKCLHMDLFPCAPKAYIQNTPDTSRSIIQSSETTNIFALAASCPVGGI